MTNKITTKAHFIRMLGDIFLAVIGLNLGLLIRFIYQITATNYQLNLQNTVLSYVSYALFLSPLICFFVPFFANLFNIYNFQNNITLNSKIIILLKVSILPYIILSLSAYLLPTYITMPRSILFLGSIFTFFMLVSARLVSNSIKTMLINESGLSASPIRDPQKVLLIGGGGYIGSALIPKLIKEGYKIRLLDLFIYGREPIQEFINHPLLEIFEGDFRQISVIVPALNQVGSVIHLGGIVGDPACSLDEQLTIEINLVATRTIAEVAKTHGIRRFIFASTCSVYGASDFLLNEESSLNPVSLYAKSKIASEKVLQNMVSEDFSPVILRFGTIFGLSGRPRFDLVVNLLSAKAFVDKKMIVYGGEQWRPFVHVEDAAESVFLALKAPITKVAGQTINIGTNNQNYTLKQVGEIIKEILPDAELIEMEGDSDKRNYKVNFDKAKAFLGFNAQWTLEKGVKQIVSAFQSNIISDYSDPKFSNVNFLKNNKKYMINKDFGWEEKLLNQINEE